MKNIAYKTALMVTIIAASSVVQARGLNFSDMDTDKSGSVSEEEFNNAKALRMGAMAAQGRQMRGMKNGLVFADIDANNDGQLSPEEIQQAQMKHRGMMRRGNGQGSQNAGMNKARGNGNGMGRPPQPVFADFDVNNDKIVTEQEYYSARDKRIADRAKEGRQMKGLSSIATFPDLDLNADGGVTESEFNAFLADHMQSKH